MKRLSKLLVAAGIGVGIAHSAMADDAITLRMGTFIPAKHNGVTQGDDIFTQKVAELTKGKVKIEFYPAQQAGKAREALDLVKAGAIDIYGIGTGYFSNSDVPLWGLLEAPNLVKHVCDATRAMREVGKPGGILWDKQYKPMGIRILSYYVYPPYGPSASHKPITKVSDLQGLKMRNAGGLMERTVAALGGTPVAITSPEVMQALERKTLDSWMGAFSSVRNYEYFRYGKYGATGFSMGTPGIFNAMNEAKFQSLPKDIQDALVEAGRAADEHFCAFMDTDEAQTIKDLQTDKYGMEIYTWTPEQVAKMEGMTADVVSKWIKDLEARGIPAGDAMKAYKAALGK